MSNPKSPSPWRLVGSAPALTERDLEMLRLLGEGRSFSEIAATLGLAYKTVANAATVIKSKLGVARTADLIRLSVEMGIPAIRNRRSPGNPMG